MFRQQIVDWITNTEHKQLAESLQVDSAVNPYDSISCAGTPIPSGASKISKGSSRARSRCGRTLSVAAARAKEVARIAELKADISMLEKHQTLDEEKFRLQQEKLRLNLEAEMVKTTAKERVYAAMISSSLPEVKAFKIGDRDKGSLSTCYQPPREKVYSRQGAPPRPWWSVDSVPYSQFDLTAKIFIHIILYSAVPIYDFHIFIPSSLSFHG